MQRKALVVDDEPLVASLTASTLQAAGFDVRTAGSAGEARRQVDSFDPDVAILDISLGSGPTGVDLAHALDATHPGLGLLFLTKVTDLRTMNLTADDFGGPALEGCNEILNVSRPDIITAIHNAYLDTGIDAIETNTFGANWSNLSDYNIENRIEELAEAGVKAVVNVAASSSGRFPNPGPLELVRGGVCLVDAPGADLFEQVAEGVTTRMAALWVAIRGLETAVPQVSVSGVP